MSTLDTIVSNRNMDIHGNSGRSFFIATFSIGVIFGFGFGIAFLNIESWTVQPNNLNFVQFQPPRPRHNLKSTFPWVANVVVEDEEGPLLEQAEGLLGEDARIQGQLQTPSSHIGTGSSPDEIESLSGRYSSDERQPKLLTKYKAKEEEALKLAREVRVLCWVMTRPSFHKEKALHVKRIWGEKCDKLLFMSSENDTELPSISLNNVEDGRDYLWAKTREAFKYVYEHHLDDADWFMKADDDTFVVVENLRYFLKDFDFNYPIFFGCKFKAYVENGYMSGGAGYVLSKEALRRFVEDALPNFHKCPPRLTQAEDVEMGKCMQNVGVEAGDSRDAHGRYRFLPFIPAHHVLPDQIRDDFWYWKNLYYPQKDGADCCSDTAITFHYVNPIEMYFINFVLYRLNTVGDNNRKDVSKETSSFCRPHYKSRLASESPDSEGNEDSGGAIPIIKIDAHSKIKLRSVVRQPNKRVTISAINKVTTSTAKMSNRSVQSPRNKSISIMVSRQLGDNINK